ncbi:MAG: L,D-transpeptidase family protein [Henriciella sp.]|nr:L,D-transpeptidase family protein [Henriciella sp.]
MTAVEFTATAKGKFSGGDVTCRCALGKGGIVGAALKREGDGASPLGRWEMRRVFYRADRVDRPETGLPCVALRESDGWCDDPEHPLYNRPVALPFAASHEKLWREDHVYDLIVELGHNDSPPQPGRGSAIFFHLARPDYRPTEGCVAVAKEDMLAALKQTGPGSKLTISF